MAGKGVRADAGAVVRVDSVLVEGVDPNVGPAAAGLSPMIYELAATAPNGLPTTGFLFSITTGGARTATPPGFTVTIYRWSASAQRWLSFAAKTAVNLDELYACYDIDGGAQLFVSVSNMAAGAGRIQFYFQEQ